ncbi:BLUF domain-containing protein [Spirosoma flavum]|uniref:BLUF domain-containing protein n=1 Tax=Spirosoma flavum TaxID=2048557 RepID=A0ABW6AS95_9BACT
MYRHENIHEKYQLFLCKDVCLIYFSTAVKLLQEEELLSLLAHSRSQNSQVGITGALLYVKGNFVQVLEGDKQVVKDLYVCIAQDPRHTNVSLAINRPITQRLFATWSMGYETITLSELAEIQAIVQLNAGDQSVMNSADNAILRTLQVFYQGNHYN